jgi:hypothetical protein
MPVSSIVTRRRESLLGWARGVGRQCPDFPASRAITLQAANDPTVCPKAPRSHSQSRVFNASSLRSLVTLDDENEMGRILLAGGSRGTDANRMIGLEGSQRLGANDPSSGVVHGRVMTRPGKASESLPRSAKVPSELRRWGDTVASGSS